jgi:site-specific DNA-methyltransferase (adenine-specific)
LLTPFFAESGVAIYHGDCREVLTALGPLPADARLISDPPYGIGYRHGARKGGVRLGMDGESIAGDDKPFDPAHLLALGLRTVLWGGNHFANSLPASPGWLIWDKRAGGPTMDQADAELAWTNVLTVARVFTRRWSGATRGGREQREGRWHTNQKPVALMDWCIQLVGAGPIIDPYCGSGSTLVAAKERGLPAIGIEIDERHCASAAERLRQGVLDLGAA